MEEYFNTKENRCFVLLFMGSKAIILVWSYQTRSIESRADIMT